MKDIALWLLGLTEYNKMINNTKKFAKEVKNFYFEGHLTEHFIQNFNEIVADATITWPIMKALESQSKFGDSSIYLFHLAYNGTFSFIGGCNNTDLEQCQIVKFTSLNDSVPMQGRNEGDNERNIMYVMAELLATFAREKLARISEMLGWPNYRDTSGLMNSGNGNSTSITVGANFLTKRMKFWDNVLPNVLIARYRHLYRKLLSTKV